MAADPRDDVPDAAWRIAAGAPSRPLWFGLSLVLALASVTASAQALPVPRLPALTRSGRDTAEARQIERTVWKQVLVRCGRDWVFALESRHQRPMQFRKTNFQFESTTDRLTPAQRANGLQWQGGFYVNSPLFRTYVGLDRAPEGSAGWEPWQDNFTTSVQAGFDLRKLDGQWQIRDHERGDFAPFDAGALTVKPVACAASGEPSFHD